MSNLNDSKPVYTDVSRDSRAWEEVVPDQYWGPEHCMGKEIVLQIGAVQTEQYGDDLPRAVLVFRNDKKWLRVSRDARQTLKELFGLSPSNAIGQWITITAGPNQMKTIVVKILPRQTAPPGGGPSNGGANNLSDSELEELMRIRRERAALQTTTA